MNNPRRSSYVEIDIAAFRWNFNQIRKLVSPAKIIAVVKANAYGHGLEVIAREAERLGSAYLCVAFVQEGIFLRDLGIQCPVLVLLPPVGREINAALEYGLELVGHSFDSAREIDAEAKQMNKKVPVQVNIDTGMHRTGIQWENAVQELNKINSLKNVNINGIFTHFATADWQVLDYAREQLNRFNQVLRDLKFPILVIHAANSGAVMQLKESYFTMVRPGISLYGCYPSMQCRRTLRLKPVMTFKSYVAHVKEYRAHERFGYSRTYETGKRTRIATVPAGYADGVNRLLSNSAHVLIRGKKHPVAGLVSMDSIMVDIGLESEVAEGDEVVLFGEQKHNAVSIDDWCEILHTIPYEVTCNISSRIPRVFLNEKQ